MTSAKPLSKGDILLVDFEAWTDTGELFDTTRTEVAKKAGWDTEIPLRSMPVLLGGGRVVPGFEDELLKAAPGKEGEVVIPPTKGFGLHNAGLVKTYPRKDFEKREVEPKAGVQIEVGGKRGTVIQATASRVRVDFNNPYAGRTLTYKYKVLDVVTDAVERVKALLGIDYSVLQSDQFTVALDGQAARIAVPEGVAFDARWFMSKHRLAHDLFEHTDLESVEFVEPLTRKQMEAHGHGTKSAPEGPPEASGSQEAADDGLTEEERL